MSETAGDDADLVTARSSTDIEDALSTPTNGAPYQQRVMIEVVSAGVPRRVHVWTNDGETLVSFPSGMTEAEATQIVGTGLSLLRPLDVAALFREVQPKRRRYIEAEDD